MSREVKELCGECIDLEECWTYAIEGDECPGFWEELVKIKEENNE